MLSANSIPKNKSLKCPFCGGIYVQKQHGYRCLMCDRSADVEYELYVMKRKRKINGPTIEKMEDDHENRAL